MALTVLPATDFYLMGRHMRPHVMRGVTPAHQMLHAGVNCSLSTNNVLNPFTPFGDCSLPPHGQPLCQHLPGWRAGGRARLFRHDHDALRPTTCACTEYGVEVGKWADLVVLDCPEPETAIAEIATPLYGFKRGRPTFTRERAVLHRPR